MAELQQRRPRTAAEVIDDAASYDPEVAELVRRNEATLAALHGDLDEMRAELCVPPPRLCAWLSGALCLRRWSCVPACACLRVRA